ncbi:lipocalin-like domain-containing protein [Flavobacterium sp. 3HN19-14]|uniref:lipocalin-like domain-containing protein n=1 Tax=Flavobacterium sp. 3HN19-14 TaxID=3448133 RepID=UPI003EDFEB11
MQWNSDGWPVVSPERYAAVPQTDIANANFVGNWQIITMSYQYKQQQHSVNVTLASDGAIVGGMTGTWHYDSSKRAVYLNNIECKISNGWDWEASPRHRTITLSGLTGDGKPVWGKKVN